MTNCSVRRLKSTCFPDMHSERVDLSRPRMDTVHRSIWDVDLMPRQEKKHLGQKNAFT